MPNETDETKREPIEPDEQAILALRRVTFGADAHGTNALICKYQWACSDGDADRAVQLKRQMAERAIALERVRAKFGDSTVN